jgi:hypothetical protein
MPSSTSEKAGQILISIGFFDFSKHQGWWGKLTQLVGGSKITHVAPIFNYTTRTTITLIPNEKARLHKLKLFDDCLVDEIPFHYMDIDMNMLVDVASDYADTTVWDAVFYHFIGKYLGLTRPRNCTTFVCSLLGLPEHWHPADLYKHMKGSI